FKLNPAEPFKFAEKALQCYWGDVFYDDGENVYGTIIKNKDSAKCTRPRESLCESPGGNVTGLEKYVDGEKVMLKCSTKFAFVNNKLFSKADLKCSQYSTPESHLWTGDNDVFTDVEIKNISCVDKLNCDLLDHIDFDTEHLCDNCTKVQITNGRFTCPAGAALVMIETNNNTHTKLDKITCDSDSGKWEYG
ncbi:hypothetical protein PFISCL1PPCAC_21584, partial [Pristionchus fissidentatus]